ncbi:MAG: hypothetical protein U0412_07245 [Nitrospira sp.]
MKLSSNRPSWPSAALRIWIIVWVLAVPLFHIHPEADHRHGHADHVHGGTVHTVFSPDLDGEFDIHKRTLAEGEPTAASPASMSKHPAHAADYTELGFSFVSDSTDRSLHKPILTVGVPVTPPAALDWHLASGAQTDVSFSYPLTLLTRDIPSRAPPSLVL